MPFRSTMAKKSRIPRLLSAGALLALGGTALLAWAFDLQALLVLALVGLALVAVLRVGLFVLRRLLYRVSSQLGFSYFLMGVLPVPMVVLLLGIAGWAAAGILAGHVYRSSLDSLVRELQVLADAELDRGDRLRSGETLGSARLARYRDGVKVAGHRALPERLPSWLLTPREADKGVRLATVDGRPTPLALSSDGEGAAVLAVWAGLDLQAALATRSGVWARLERWESNRGKRGAVMVQVGDLGFTWSELQQWRRSQPPPLGFFDASPDPPWFRQPLVRWADLLGTARPLDEAEVTTQQPRYIGALLTATPQVVYRRVFASAGEIDLAALAVLLVVAFLLFDVYVVALGMAVFVVVGLSRAVNRLSAATGRVLEGDFTARIPVRRRDQLGALQLSFNEMSHSLERLVADTAEKERLQKELELARQVQRSLLPEALESAEGIDFASSFEPSAAIGGDYFDLFRLDRHRLGIVIADVSGHGLSAGLRMAMVKAALEMLVEQQLEPRAILARLHRMVRAQRIESGGRSMVTATLAILDLQSHRLSLVNAGHAPTWIVRGSGQVDEEVLPGPPLGGIGEAYGETCVELAPGDLVVFLSDGLIEALDARGEPFGYERITKALAGAVGKGTAEARDLLLRRIAEYTGGRPPDDDRTLLVMRIG